VFFTLMQRSTVWTGWWSPARRTRLLRRWGDAVGGPAAGSQRRLPVCGLTLVGVRLAVRMAAGESRRGSHFARTGFLGSPGSRVCVLRSRVVCLIARRGRSRRRGLLPVGLLSIWGSTAGWRREGPGGAPRSRLAGRGVSLLGDGEARRPQAGSRLVEQDPGRLGAPRAGESWRRGL
jgi:hypothetical protein